MKSYSFLLGIFIPLLILLSILFWSFKNGIVPMPSSRKQKGCMIGCIPTNIEGIILELGSGWGSLAFSLARRFPKCRIIGYESSPIPFLLSKVLFRLPNLQFQRKDFLQTSLAGAAVIICYLYPGGMQKLKPKLEDELTPGTWIISNTFAVPGWEARDILEVDDLYRSKIYLYKL